VPTYRSAFIAIASASVVWLVLPTVVGSEVASSIWRVVAYCGTVFFLGLAILGVRRKATPLIVLAAILIGVGCLLSAVNFEGAGIVTAATGIVIAAVEELR